MPFGHASDPTASPHSLWVPRTPPCRRPAPPSPHARIASIPFRLVGRLSAPRTSAGTEEDEQDDAAIGSLMMEVSAAPSLQLFANPRDGRASPLSRSVEDITSQLDRLSRTFHAASRTDPGDSGPGLPPASFHAGSPPHTARGVGLLSGQLSAEGSAPAAQPPIGVATSPISSPLIAPHLHPQLTIPQLYLSPTAPTPAVQAVAVTLGQQSSAEGAPPATQLIPERPAVGGHRDSSGAAPDTSAATPAGPSSAPLPATAAISSGREFDSTEAEPRAISSGRELDSTEAILQASSPPNEAALFPFARGVTE